MNIKALSLIAFLFLLPVLTFAQSGSLKGIIEDEFGAPVPASLIQIKGTQFQTKTDNTGMFLFENLDFGEYVLEVNALDMGIQTFNATVDKLENDLGKLKVAPPTPLNTQELPSVNLTESDLGEGSNSNVSGVLTASRDVFTSAAAFTFGPARFRIRGYDSENTVTYMNGAPMTQLFNGRTPFYLWGGLNDVLRSRDNSLGLAPASFAFGGIGGANSTDSRATRQRKQISASYASSNRAYENRLMVTYGSGILSNGWSFAASGSRRWADEGYVAGTYYDGWSYYLGTEKLIGLNHSVSLTVIGTPTERGKASPSVQEMYDIAGTNFYNPTWGFQDGKKRNASINETHQPLFIAGHDWKLDDKSNLQSSLSYTFGKNINTGLDWYNAPDPRPDFYRKLPSYIEDAATASLVAQILRDNEAMRQINWDQMYQTNYSSLETINNIDGIAGKTITGKRSHYILENRVSDDKNLSLNTIYNTTFQDNILFTAGATYQHQVSDNYKEVRDLLGGEFYMDLNQYAEQDFPDSTEALQNDLNRPNRVVKVGDRLGYDYTSTINKVSTWGQGQIKLEKFDVFASLELSSTSYFRTGNVRNGLFQNTSYGDSEKQSFINAGLKAGTTYKLDGRNYLTLNAAYLTRAPYMDNAFTSIRTHNQVISGLVNEKISTVEGGFQHRAPKLKVKAFAYLTDFNDGTNTVSFYHGDFRTFVNYTLTNLDKRHIGTEFAVDANVYKGLNVSAVAAIGSYYYTDRAKATISADNTAELLADNETIYSTNLPVAGSPQQAYTLGLNYRSPKFWFLNVNFNMFDGMYLDFNPARRTQNAVDLVTPDSDSWNNILDPLKLDSQFTIDVFGGKSWKMNNHIKSLKKNTFLVLNVGVSNLTNNTEFITGGYEQLRFDFEGKDQNRFAPKLFYMYGTTYFASLTLRMN